LWQPIPGKFDDYIAVPRDNLYRSLHTAVIHNNGQHLKLRLRTVAMDKVDSIGILSRWLHKGTPLWSQGIADRIDTFLGNISESINVEPQNPSQSVKGAVEDVLGEQIRVYTPQGDMRDLTKGATPIDFAYAIHTGLGEQCSAAFVNDVPYPLNKPLRDGDQVRIVKRTRAQPIRAWLDEDLGYIVTNYARSHVRRWFRRLTEDTAVTQGKTLLEDELAMLGIPHYNHEKIAHLFNYENTTPLYHDLGRAELLPTTVALHLLEEIWNDEPLRALDNVVYAASGERFVVTHADRSQLRLCGTCQPRPPGSIVGFIRHDGGVTIHNRTCHTLRPDKMIGRMLKLGWAETPRQARQVNIQVKVFDRPGLLFEITHLIQDEQINIAFIHTPPAISTGEVHIDLTLEVVKPRQMVRILHQIQALHNIFSVQSFPTQSTFAKDLLPSNSLYRPE
jgi:GTP pyrophosphokinase